MRWHWFYKTLTFIWLLSIITFGVLFSAAHNTNVRHIGGIVGTLEQPLTKSKKAAVKLFQNSLKNPEAQAQLSVIDVATVAQNSINAAIRSAVSSFISSLVSTILGWFDTLLNTIEDATEALTGVRLNLGSVRQAMALKVTALGNSVTDNINDWMTLNWSVSDGDLYEYNKNCILLYDSYSIVNYATQGVDNVREVFATESATIRLRQRCAQLGARSTCNADFVKLSGTIQGVFGNGSLCEVEVYSRLDNTLRNRALSKFSAFDSFTKQFDSTCDYAKGLAVVENQGDGQQTLNQVNARMASGDVEGAFLKITDDFRLVPISSSLCSFIGEEADLAQNALGINTSPPNVDILASLLSSIQDFLIKIVDKVVSSIIKKVFDSIDKFFNNLIGVGVFSGIGQAFSDAAKIISATALEAAGNNLKLASARGLQATGNGLSGIFD